MSHPLNPKHNHVTFKLRLASSATGSDHYKELSGVGPAQAVDCVAAIWNSLTESTDFQAAGYNAQQVVEVYSEWEPAEEDQRFLDDNFPEEAELAFSFKRPGPGGWPAALDEAAKVIEASSKHGAMN